MDLVYKTIGRLSKFFVTRISISLLILFDLKRVQFPVLELERIKRKKKRFSFQYTGVTQNGVVGQIVIQYVEKRERRRDNVIVQILNQVLVVMIVKMKINKLNLVIALTVPVSQNLYIIYHTPIQGLSITLKKNAWDLVFTVDFWNTREI